MTPTPLPLTSADLKAHDALGITHTMLERAKVRRVDDREAQTILGLKRSKLAGIAYPYLHPTTGDVRAYRIRRDHPDIEKGKPKNKYLWPAGQRKFLYFSPGCDAFLTNLAALLIIVEAEKSVLAVACAAERLGRAAFAIGTGGCWGWRGRIGLESDANGAHVDTKGPLPDWDRIEMQGRTVVIAFDANTATNEKVQDARRALTKELTTRGATVRLLNLPSESGINGPDDYLGRHGAEAFFALVDQAGTPARLTVHLASKVHIEPLEKLCGGRLVRRAFGLLSGPGDAGKGMTLVALAACFTTGNPFPGDTERREPANVLFCVTEDHESVVASRLLAAGADLDRLNFLRGPEVVRGGLRMPSNMMLDDDAGALVEEAKMFGAHAIFLETTVEHFGDRQGKAARRSTNNDADVRAALAPFRAVCLGANLFGLGAIHPNKRAPTADDSISGSAAFRNVARGIHHIYRDPEDESDNPVRLFFTSKANYLKRRPATLRFQIVSWDQTLDAACDCPNDNDCPHEGRVIWLDPLTDDRTAEEIWYQIAEASKPRKEDAAAKEAEAFLERVLGNGTVVPLEVIETQAQAESVSMKAVQRAKKTLGVVLVKEGFPAKVVGWKLAKTPVAM